MLHKAVDIHFDMNYKRLCANQNVDMDRPDEESMDAEDNQINSKSTEYNQSDYDAICIQILNYVQVNLLQFFTQANKPL